MTKRLLLLSGGFDSTCLFHYYLNQSIPFSCMFIDYGQVNAAEEYASARKLCEKYGYVLQYVGCKNVFHGIDSSILQHDVAVRTVKNSELPNRNAVLMNIAASHCKHDTVIAVGAHRTPAEYADCTSRFYTMMSKMLQYSTSGRVSCEAPFIRYTKATLARKVIAMGADVQDLRNSVSCYEGTECGRCPACKSRKEILHILNL